MQRDFFPCGTDTARRKLERHGKDRLPLASGGVHRVHELVTSLPLKTDLIRLLLAEWGMNQEPEGAPRFEHRAMASMLWQKWPLAVAVRLQADAGPARIGKETDFHFRILQDCVEAASGRTALAA